MPDGEIAPQTITGAVTTSCSKRSASWWAVHAIHCP